MILVDSHCHLDQLDLASYQNDLSAAIQAATQNHVKYFLCVCAELIHLPTIIKIAEEYPTVFASVGLHPTEKVTHEPSVSELINLAQHPKIVAMGETGLDYYRPEIDNAWQAQRFINHIQAAKQLQLPLIIHTRQARADTMRLLKQENAESVGGVMHCFTEDWTMAKQALDLGFYISFSGIVTFKNATEIQEVAKKVPLEKMLIETDSPYLAPVPMRGKSNQPAYVRYVAEYLAQLKGISVQTVAEQTTQNFFALFKKCKL